MSRFVLVHGAFAKRAVWDRVAPGLRSAGHLVEAVDLPGAGADQTPVAEITLDRYAERVCEALAAGPPAVLVGHSMGGMVITQAASRCPDRIERLVYVAALVPADGQSLSDLTQLPEAGPNSARASLVVQGDPPVATMPREAIRETLLNCSTDEQADWAISLRGPQALAPFTNPVSLDGPASDAFAALPRAYVMSLRDRVLPPALQRRMLEAAGCNPVIEIDTDHSAYASRPEELAAALNSIAK